MTILTQKELVNFFAHPDRFFVDVVVTDTTLVPTTTILGVIVEFFLVRVYVDTDGGDRTINLPPVLGLDRVSFWIINVGSNKVNVVPATGEKLDGVTGTKEIINQWNAFGLTLDRLNNTGWIAKNRITP